MHAARYILSARATHLALAADAVVDNPAWPSAKPRLSVAIPAFRCDASFLVHALAACRASDQIEIIVYDDGSRDPNLRNRHESAGRRLGVPVRVVSAVANRGRAAARNQAATHARADWVLFLDADMRPDDAAFIETYLAAADAADGPMLVVGGISLKQATTDRRYALHRWQSEASECLTAEERARSPALNVFTGNVLAHRKVIESQPFDEGFAGWGWEDTDWGLGVGRTFPIRHIDNTATHTGLDLDAELVSKYGRSAANFARLAARHPVETAGMPLHRAARIGRNLPGRRLLATAARDTALNTHLPLAIRGRALKAWRALAYSDLA